MPRGIDDLDDVYSAIDAGGGSVDHIEVYTFANRLYCHVLVAEPGDRLVSPASDGAAPPPLACDTCIAKGKVR